jgi:hypothetical protein
LRPLIELCAIPFGWVGAVLAMDDGLRDLTKVYFAVY